MGAHTKPLKFSLQSSWLIQEAGVWDPDSRQDLEPGDALAHAACLSQRAQHDTSAPPGVAPPAAEPGRAQPRGRRPRLPPGVLPQPPARRALPQPPARRALPQPPARRALPQPPAARFLSRRRALPQPPARRALPQPPAARFLSRPPRASSAARDVRRPRLACPRPPFGLYLLTEAMKSVWGQLQGSAFGPPAGPPPLPASVECSALKELFLPENQVPVLFGGICGMSSSWRVTGTGCAGVSTPGHHMALVSVHFLARPVHLGLADSSSGFRGTARRPEAEGTSMGIIHWSASRSLN
ncbi:uncharacterized protein LOC102159535 [Sus scrofa]|uniref:uncharacterized protein LOC102159535 n=1 Tax=Sus scrofa TaxID=9823 RepID=UPI000A2AF893|nr:uncharacterized protein LOC102159535 [Sus scrofa]